MLASETYFPGDDGRLSPLPPFVERH